MKSIMAQMRNTIEDKHLINDGDRVAVGLSGGKDSMALLYALREFQKYNVIRYELCAISINPGFKGFKSNEMKAFCDDLGVPFYEEKTQIYQIVFETRKEKNPCSLCAKMRRGALTDVMNRHGYTILALGHHNDDAIATLLMNMLNTGRMKIMEFCTELEKSGVKVIRPLLEVTENQVIGYVNKNNIPIVKSECPVDKKTNREQMGELMKQIYKTVPGARASINTAMKNEEHLSLWF